MNPPPQAVYDCNVLVQALISKRGPAYAAFEAAGEGRVDLFRSPHIVDELRRVAARPSLAIRFSLTEKRVNEFVDMLEGRSHCMTAVPRVFDLDRDPDDANLQVVTMPQLLALISLENETGRG